MAIWVNIHRTANPLEELEKYLKNPNKCMYCGKIILLADGQRICDLKRKTFCNTSCAAKFNNHKRKITTSDITTICPTCGGKKSRNGRLCRICSRDEKLLGQFYKITKGELFKSRGYFNARSLIQGHALAMWKRFGSKSICTVCGYNNYVEVCHIKSVSSFSDSATVLEINDINNLVSLCPNHHWEYDHGVLKL